MLKKIFKFIKGYVIIEVTGKNKERFVNMCLVNLLNIYDIVPGGDGLLMKTDRAGFAAMRRLARKSGTRVRILKKCGLPHIMHQYRRRYGFFVSGAAVCIFLFLLPQYILCVEIDGAYNSDKERIYEVLREHGVYVGAKKSRVDDLSEIKNSVIFGIDGISWAWLYDEGAKMRLEIQESVPKPEVKDKSVPTDIVAAYDGWITSADVYLGERRVSAGTAVAAGDVLVSGKVAVFPPGGEENYIYVHSDAKIMADTVRCETAGFKATETLRIRTGRSKKRLSAVIFGKEIKLYKGFGFDEYDISVKRYDFNIPIIGYSGLTLNVETAFEVNELQRTLSVQEVIERAGEKLSERICKKLGAGAVKRSEELTYSENGGTYTVELRMHLTENIGIEVPAQG